MGHLFTWVETPVCSMHGMIWKWERVKGSSGLFDPCSVLASPGLAPASVRGQVNAKKSYRKAGASLSCVCFGAPGSTLPSWLEASIHYSGPPLQPLAHPLFISNRTSKLALWGLCVSPTCFIVSQHCPLMPHPYPFTLELLLVLIPNSESETLEWLWQLVCLTRHSVLQSRQ